MNNYPNQTEVNNGRDGPGRGGPPGQGAQRPLRLPTLAAAASAARPWNPNGAINLPRPAARGRPRPRPLVFPFSLGYRPSPLLHSASSGVRHSFSFVSPLLSSRFSLLPWLAGTLGETSGGANGWPRPCPWREGARPDSFVTSSPWLTCYRRPQKLPPSLRVLSALRGPF